MRLERPVVPPSEALERARALYLDLQYAEALETLNRGVTAVQIPSLQIETRWWIALCQTALGRDDEARRSLDALVTQDPLYSITPEESRKLGAQKLRAVLQELRRAKHPSLIRTIHPIQAELSRAEEAPVLGRRWPLWKKLLVYGAAPIAVGVGVFALAGGGDSGPDPLEITPSIVGSPNPNFECVPVSATGTVVTKTFSVQVRGGSGNYGIEWNFNRGSGGARVSPSRASDTVSRTVTYGIDAVSDFGSYAITVEVRDRDLPEQAPVQNALILIINTPSVCTP